MSIGERLKSLRLENNKTLRELGEIFDVSLNTIYRWEHDQIIPRKHTLAKIAEYYDVPVGSILQRRNTDSDNLEHARHVRKGRGANTAKDIDLELLTMFRKLPENSKHKVLGYVEGILVENNIR